MIRNRLVDIKLTRSPNQRFAWFLVHSFLYYIADQPVLRDRDFDMLCQTLVKEWDEVDHPHKHLVTLDDLKASSGFAIKFPLMVEGAAWNLLRKLNQASAPVASFTPIVPIK